MLKIKVINFKSEPKQNYFAPEWNWYLFETHINKIDFDDLTKFCLSKKNKILKLNSSIYNNKFTDGGTGLGKNSTTAKFKNYNVLKWKNKNITLLKKSIVEFHNEILGYFKYPLIEELWVQCWVNIMKKGQKIKPHLHGVTPTTYLGGHFCVQCNNTSTYYINPINQIKDPVIHKSFNEVGKLTIFQNNIPHYTDIHKGKKDRITIAFDLKTTIKPEERNNYLRLI